MQTKRKSVYLMVLGALIVLGASCGGSSIIAETTNQAEQTIEPTSTSLVGVLDNNEESADATTGPNQVGSTSDTTSSTLLSVTSTVAQSNTSSTTSTVINGSSSTTVVASTIVTPNKELSQAWVDSQVALSKVGSDNVADSNYYNEYLSINPNDVSTPMGALCWSFHELVRSQHMDSLRSMLDYHMVPFLMENYGITDEQIGPPGPKATDEFFSLILSDIGPVGSVDDSSGQIDTPGENGVVGPVVSIDGTDDAMTETDTIGFFNDLHVFAGDGTAWPDAVRIIASPEMAAAFAAGEGLPVEVQIYADALIVFAREHVGMPLDDSAESDVFNFTGIDFPGIDAFVEEAKYNQNCKRAMIAT